MPALKTVADVSAYLKDYSDFRRNGVICFTLASLVSLCAITYLLAFKPPKPRTYHKTHLFAYILCLFIANILQAVGVVINFQWVVDNGILRTNSMLCQAQGGLRQFGNLASAFWAAMIAIHLFHILFSRKPSRAGSLWFSMIFGWGLVLFFVLLGPLVLQRPDRGNYYTVSGTECWISNSYPMEQIFLEYFLQYVAAGISLVLYTLILLRVRGNLHKTDGGWQVRSIPSEETWQLAYGRDLVDTSMYKIAHCMLWYPVVSVLTLLPISVTKISQLSNARIPFGVTVFVSIVYNLNGLINVILHFQSQKHFPDLSALPLFDDGRKKKFRLSMQPPGLSPFTLQRSDTAEKFHRERELNVQVAQIAAPQMAYQPRRSTDTESDFEIMGRSSGDARAPSVVSNAQSYGGPRRWI